MILCAGPLFCAYGDKAMEQETGQETELKSSFSFYSFEEMARQIPDKRATHYRYYQEGNVRKRYKEEGRLFSLDSDEDDQSRWPKARKGSWLVDLFVQRTDTEGKAQVDEAGEPQVTPIDFAPGNPNIILRVDLAGRPPPTPIASSSDLKVDPVLLQTLKEAHEVIREQRKWPM